MKKRPFTFFLVIVVVIILAVFFLRFIMGGREEELIGGQRDEHGCLGPAGYSWCEAKNKCLRIWEEACE